VPFHQIRAAFFPLRQTPSASPGAQTAAFPPFSLHFGAGIASTRALSCKLIFRYAQKYGRSSLVYEFLISHFDYSSVIFAGTFLFFRR